MINNFRISRKVIIVQSVFVILTACLLPVRAQQWLLPTPWGNPVTEISFFDDNLGLAAVRYDGLYRTMNGGDDWVKTHDLTSYDCKQIALLSEDH